MASVNPNVFPAVLYGLYDQRYALKGETSGEQGGIDVYAVAGTRNQAAIDYAITQYPGYRLFFDSGTWSVTTDTTFPDTCEVYTEPGTLFSIASGKILLFKAHLNTGLYQVFTGSGKVRFWKGSIEEAYPQWWGADATGATDSITQIQAAIDAIANINIEAATPAEWEAAKANYAGGGDVKILGTFKITDTIELRPRVNLKGLGAGVGRWSSWSADETIQNMFLGPSVIVNASTNWAHAIHVGTPPDILDIIATAHSVTRAELISDVDLALTATESSYLYAHSCVENEVSGLAIVGTYDPTTGIGQTGCGIVVGDPTQDPDNYIPIGMPTTNYQYAGSLIGDIGSSLITVTTRRNHGLDTGDSVWIGDFLPSSYNTNAYYTVTVSSATEFTYTSPTTVSATSAYGGNMFFYGISSAHRYLQSYGSGYNVRIEKNYVAMHAMGGIFVSGAASCKIRDNWCVYNRFGYYGAGVVNGADIVGNHFQSNFSFGLKVDGAQAQHIANNVLENNGQAHIYNVFSFYHSNWEVGHEYIRGDICLADHNQFGFDGGTGGYPEYYICTWPNTASATDEPGTGTYWRKYWSPFANAHAEIINSNSVQYTNYHENNMYGTTTGAIAVTTITNNVCYSTDTQDIAVGDYVRFTVDDDTIRKIYRVTSVNDNSDFTIAATTTITGVSDEIAYGINIYTCNDSAVYLGDNCSAINIDSCGFYYTLNGVYLDDVNRSGVGTLSTKVAIQNCRHEPGSNFRTSTLSTNSVQRLYPPSTGSSHFAYVNYASDYGTRYAHVTFNNNSVFATDQNGSTSYKEPIICGIDNLSSGYPSTSYPGWGAGIKIDGERTFRMYNQSLGFGITPRTGNDGVSKIQGGSYYLDKVDGVNDQDLRIMPPSMFMLQGINMGYSTPYYCLSMFHIANATISVVDIASANVTHEGGTADHLNIYYSTITQTIHAQNLTAYDLQLSWMGFGNVLYDTNHPEYYQY